MFFLKPFYLKNKLVFLKMKKEEPFGTSLKILTFLNL